jgi:hypothetical protein
MDVTSEAFQRRALAIPTCRAYSATMTNVIFTPEQYAAALARLKRKLAARQAAKEAVDRIVAGAPRSSFGKFTLSFDEIAPDNGRPESNYSCL